MLKEGSVFAGYTILNHIGSGGHAIVYRARNSADQIVAVKILSDVESGKANIVERFIREAEIVSTLNHYNIVSIFEHGVYQDRPFIAMEYFKGGSLTAYFQKKKAVRLKTTSGILFQVASALDFAHQHGVIHRDLKPDNILIDEKKRVALGDFGIALAFQEPRLTMETRLAGGTLLYMSPEQCRSLKLVDRRTDYYALAVCAYLMYTGYHPFTHEQEFVIVEKQLSHQPPLPSQVNPRLTADIDRVLLKGLAKNPDDRYESAIDFVNALRNATHHNMSVAIEPYAMNPMPSKLLQNGMPTRRARRPSAREKLLSLMTGVFVILLAAVAGVFLLTGGFGRGDNGTPTDVSMTQPTLILSEVAAAWTATPTPTQTPTHTPTFTSSPTHTDTPTVTPSATSTATSTYTPSATITDTPMVSNTPMGDARVGSDNGANLRNEPKSNAAIAASLPKDTVLWLIGRTASNQWFQVQTSGNQRGWVYFSDINIFSGASLPPITWVDTPTPVVSTSGAICGNGICSAGENSSTCPSDCGGSSTVYCGNGSCETGENSSTCPSDCQTQPVCGNGSCETGENSSTCPSDCQIQPVCGNHTCEVGENAYSCPADCSYCGDGICAANENWSTCSLDCASPTPWIPTPTYTPAPYVNVQSLSWSPTSGDVIRPGNSIGYSMSYTSNVPTVATFTSYWSYNYLQTGNCTVGTLEPPGTDWPFIMVQSEWPTAGAAGPWFQSATYTEDKSLPYPYEQANYYIYRVAVYEYFNGIQGNLLYCFRKTWSIQR